MKRRWFAAASALRIKHLHARVIGAHDGDGSINYLLVQGLGALLVNKLGTDPLQHSKVVQLRVGLSMSQGGEICRSGTRALDSGVCGHGAGLPLGASHSLLDENQAGHN